MGLNKIMTITSLFDLLILEHSHFLLALGVFVVVYALMAVLVHMQPPSLRVRRERSNTIYGGLVLVAVLALASLFVLDDARLITGLILTAVIVAAVGRRDELHSLGPGRQFLWQAVAVAIVVSAGWTIPYVTNPFGEEVIHLNWIETGNWLIPGSLVAIVWLLFYINAINWMDGINGLAGTVSLIAFVAMAAISLLPSVQRSDTLALSLIGSAGVLAFLLWNFPQAKVYLGTTGSWFVGLFLGLVAVHGGGKLATTTLVLAIPALDALFVIAQRVMAGQAPWRGDTIHHLHHRLMAAGWSSASITIMAAVVTVVLAIAAVLLPTAGKLILLVALTGLFIVLLAVLRSDANAANEHANDTNNSCF